MLTPCQDRGVRAAATGDPWLLYRSGDNWPGAAAARSDVSAVSTDSELPMRRCHGTSAAPLLLSAVNSDAVRAVRVVLELATLYADDGAPVDKAEWNVAASSPASVCAGLAAAAAAAAASDASTASWSAVGSVSGPTTSRTGSSCSAALARRLWCGLVPSAPPAAPLLGRRGTISDALRRCDASVGPAWTNASEVLRRCDPPGRRPRLRAGASSKNEAPTACPCVTSPARTTDLSAFDTRPNGGCLT